MELTPSHWSVPYQEDSRVLMMQLAGLCRPVFLDSGHQRGPNRRFDILSAEPIAWIHSQAGKVSASTPDLLVADGDIFSNIRRLKEIYLPDSELSADHHPALPFHGGLMGYLGYPTLHGRDRFTVPDAYVGVYPWALVVDHAQQRATLVALSICPEPLIDRIKQLLRQDAGAAEIGYEFRLTTPFQHNLSKSEYEHAFLRIKHYIGAGDCYQVNLTQRFSAECVGHPLAAYLRLRAGMPAPFSAFIGWPDGALLSVSPERFLQCINGPSGMKVRTQPIKGTRPRDLDPQTDQALASELLSSEKDQAENLMIVDLLRNDLGRVCELGSIQANQLFALHSFSNVHHLISTIDARLAPSKTAIDLLQACFPGGSITGAPKLRAMAVIEEVEAAPRRLYCGTAFYLGADGQMDSSITIRSLLWESGQLHCWAGGGIVDDSELTAEYAECFDKISRIINILSSQS